MNILLVLLVSFLAGMFSILTTRIFNIDTLIFSLNDFYMALITTGWVLFFIGILKSLGFMIVGLILITIGVMLFRSQFKITPTEYMRTMIPRAEMEVFISNKYLDNHPEDDILVTNLASQIRDFQEGNIKWMIDKLGGKIKTSFEEEVEEKIEDPPVQTFIKNTMKTVDTSINNTMKKIDF